MTEWRDLSDDELEQRLVERDMPAMHAQVCVMRRDDPDVETFINQWWEDHDNV